jgi:glycosyltransferase involved in cell wall biosynthesis
VLALEAFCVLCRAHPLEDWTLDMAGAGSISGDVERRIAALPSDIRSRITLHGMLPRAALAEVMSRGAVLLMTSHPGYEGYPRTLVEALAHGLPAVVTRGSDTGALIEDGVNGLTTGRDPEAIAEALHGAVTFDPEVARASVLHLSAPTVVGAILTSHADAR